MRHHKLFTALLSASSMFLFAGLASAQPSPGHHGPAAHPGNPAQCHCIGRPDCPCDKNAKPIPMHPGAKPAPVPPPHHPAAKPAPMPPHHPGMRPAPMPPAPPRHHIGMEPRSFDALIASVENKTFTNDKKRVIYTAGNHNRFSVMQVRHLLSKLTFDSDRVEVAANLYDRVEDKQNWFQVYDMFTFSSSRDDLNRRLGH